MLKVQDYYTKSKISKRQYHPNELKKDELEQHKRENNHKGETTKKKTKATEN